MIKLLKRTFVIFLFSSLFTNSYAINADNLIVKSGLEQRLSVNIELSELSDPDNIDFHVSLEDVDKHKIFGIGYDLIKVKSDDNGADNYILKVTSQKPIKDPILFLLVTATQDGKQIFSEEATLLLDSTQKAVDDVYFERYGPVTSRDTIESIAKRFKPDDVSTRAAIQAIHIANPHAFESGDINKLIIGSFLIVPDLSYGAITPSVDVKDFENLKTKVKSIERNKEISDKSLKLTNEQLKKTSDSYLQLAKKINQYDVNFGDFRNNFQKTNEKMNNQNKLYKQSNETIFDSKDKLYYLIYAFSIFIILFLAMIILLFRKIKQLQQQFNDDSESYTEKLQNDDSQEEVLSDQNNIAPKHINNLQKNSENEAKEESLISTNHDELGLIVTDDNGIGLMVEDDNEIGLMVEDDNEIGLMVEDDDGITIDNIKETKKASSEEKNSPLSFKS